MKPSLKTTLAVGYLIVAVVTFGHSASNGLPCYSGEKIGPCTSPSSSFSGIVAAIFWPLYWSWEVQS